MKQIVEGLQVLLTGGSAGRRQSPDHHLLLVSIRHNQIAIVKHNSERVYDSMKTAGRSALLCKSDDAQWLAFAVLNNSHHLGSNRNFFDVEICHLISKVSCISSCRGLTVLSCNSCKNNVALLVHLNIANAVASPLTKKYRHFLPRFSAR